MRAKLMLLTAIILEVAGTATMKYLIETDHPHSYLYMLLFISLSYYFLSKAVRSIPISLAYAVWEGLGLAGTAFIAWFIFQETMNLQKILSICIILSGLIMLKRGTSLGED